MDKFLVKQRDLLLGHADSVVLYAQEQCIGTVFNGDIYDAMSDFAFQTMYDSVFYERLENELRLLPQQIFFSISSSISSLSPKRQRWMVK